MPYIKEEERKKFESSIKKIVKQNPSNGDLNYIFNMLAYEVAKSRGVSYEVLNGLGGVFDYAGKEFYRRVVAPYEEQKIGANGDVYL